MWNICGICAVKDMLISECFAFRLLIILFKLHIHYPLTSILLSSLTSCILPRKQASTETTSARLGVYVFFNFCIVYCCVALGL